MSIEKAIGLIEQEIIDSSVNGLKTPREHTEYELGRLAGMSEGLHKSLDLINFTLQEKESDDPGDFDPIAAGMSRPLLRRVRE